MHKILVTGSSGTIGTDLCKKLLEKGYAVTGVDIKENIWSKEINNRTILLDLRNKNELFKRLPKDFDLIIHLAANARVYKLVINPDLARDNFEITFNILEFTRLNGIKNFIFSSSREVYGNCKIKHNETEAYIINCESTYTASKIGCEALVHAYNQCYNLNFMILRFSNVYGKYDSSNRLIPLFIKRARKGKDLVVYGKDKVLDFTYISDAVDGIVLSIEKFGKVKNNVFNIAYGESNTLLKVAELIKRSINPKVKVIIKENRIGEVVKFISDISKAKKLLGYSPKVKLADGIKKSIDWYSDKEL